MSVADTVTADALDAVYDLFVATTPLSTMIAAQPQTLRAFDGPPAVDWQSPYILVVGGRIEVDADDPDVVVTWDWETSGLLAQVGEDVDIPCAVAGVDGNPSNMRALRRTVIGLYAACATAVRLTNATGLASGGLGPVLGNVMWALPYVSAIRQMQGQSGAECHVLFNVKIKASI